MLYDPKWKLPETKPDVFSLEGLIAWLEKQPADGTYRYSDVRGCLIGQYLTAHGESYKNGGYGRFLTSILRVKIAALGPETFGAALERARKLASSPVQP